MMDQLKEKQIQVSRTFAAPLELLWKAWTDPNHFKKWYGPMGFTIPSAQIDLREEGKHLWSMQSPDGRQMHFTGTFKEIVPMERLIFTDSSSDAEGNVLPEGMAGHGKPDTMEVTVTFAYANGKTTVTVSHAGHGPGAEHAKLGWEQAFDKLAAMVAKV